MILKETKEQLKKLAAQIKQSRASFKECQREGKWSREFNEYEIGKLSSKFRWDHLVYCLARGRTYEQCEPKVHDRNKLDVALLQKCADELKAKIAAEVPVGTEVVCSSAV